MTMTPAATPTLSLTLALALALALAPKLTLNLTLTLTLTPTPIHEWQELDAEARAKLGHAWHRATELCLEWRRPSEAERSKEHRWQEEQEREDGVMKLGLRAVHAYTVLDVRLDVAGSGISLVKLRNPHGYTTYHGDWHSHSLKWRQHPQVARALGMADVTARRACAESGTFWIQSEAMHTWCFQMTLCLASNARIMAASRGR